jgi:hypothetical protein
MDRLSKSQRGEMDELHKASLRMGHNSLETLSWLIRFSNASLYELSEGDFQNLSAELCVFATWGMRHGSFFATEKSFGNYGRKRAERPNLADAQALKNLAQRTMCDLFNDSEVELTFRSLTLHVTVLEDKSGSHIAPIGSALLDAFSYYLAQLLGEHGQVLAPCPGCDRWFATIRVHQHFCSPRCRSRVLTRRFREAHGEKLKKAGTKPRASKGSTKPNR